jgi:hypothetical protein
MINFFTTQYYDNIKYNNYTASLLKIFFERANKVTSNISTLGNVYRNSKWSDLKIQNIKVLHIRSFVFTLLSFLSLTIFVFFVYRFDSAIVSTLTASLVWVWSYITDLLSYSLAAFFLAFYNLYSWFSFRSSLVFSKLFANNNTSISNVNVKVLTAPVTNTISTNLSPNSISSISADNSASLAAHYMFKLKFFMDTPSYTALLSPTSGSLITLSGNPVSLFLNTNSSIKPSTNSTFCLTELESSFLSSLDGLISHSASKTSLSQNKLSSFHSNPSLFSSLYSSVNSSLATAKQYRWLIRSMPISESMSISNSAFTQSKTLIDNAVWTSNLSTLNVWASSKGQNTDLTSTLKTLNTTALNTKVHMSNINFFEDSRSFLLKKSYYSMQPQYSTSILSTSFTPSLPLNNSHKPTVNITNSIISDISFFYSNQTLSNTPYDASLHNYSSSPSTSYFNSSDHLVHYKASFNNFLMDLNTTSAYSKTSMVFYNFNTDSASTTQTKLNFKY